MACKQLSAPSGNIIDNNGAAAPQAKAQDSPITLDKRSVIVHVGSFMSKDGAIVFDKQRIQHVVDRNNARLNNLRREYAGSPPVGAFPPVYEDHSDNTRATVGRLLGPFTYEERDIPGVGQQVPCVVAECVRFLGTENCDRAQDGRMYHVSIGIDESQDDLIMELSVVPEPAAPGAMLLAKGELSASKRTFYIKDKLGHVLAKIESDDESKAYMQAIKYAQANEAYDSLVEPRTGVTYKLSKGDQVKPKFEIEEKDGMFLVKVPQGYLSDEPYKTKEAAQEAGEQWQKSQPDLTEDEHKKPEAKQVKLAAEEPNKKELSKEPKGEKKMSKHKEAIEGIKRLAGEFAGMKKNLVKSSDEIKHLSRRNKVEGELRGLIRMGKMTPAEFRLAKMDDIARMDDSSRGILMDSYKNRPALVEAGQRGTTEAIEAGAMAEEIGMKRLKSETKKELKRMGAKVKMESGEDDKKEKDMKKLADDSDGSPKELSDGFAGGASKEMCDEYMSHMKHCEAAIESGDHEKAKEHMGHMKAMAEKHGPQVGMKHMAAGDMGVESSDAQASKISALEEHVGKLSSVVERISAAVEKLYSAEEAEGHDDLAAPAKEDEKHLEEKKPELSDDEKKMASEAKKDMGLGEKKEDEKKLASGDDEKKDPKEELKK